MTILAEHPTARAVLVLADVPPNPGRNRVLDVRPGPVGTFDGDRFRSRLLFRYHDDRRRSYGRGDLPDALAAASSFLDTGGVVRLGNRARLRDGWPAATIRTVERRLATAARSTGGTLLTWTDDAPDPDDASLYDVVARG